MNTDKTATPGHLTINDADADASRRANPHTGYSAYFMERVAKRIADGAGHNSLGANLVRDGESRGDFREAGRAKAKRFMQLLDISDSARVVEYGCGSLRVGVHFIEKLGPACFFGLDVTDSLYRLGIDLVGTPVIERKKPILRTITPESVSEAAAFQPTAVYSSAVCTHVHPDEAAFYFGSLQAICRANSARLVFDAAVSKEHLRYANRGWAWPEDWYARQLPQLNQRRVVTGKEKTRDGHSFAVATFVFDPVSKS